MVQTGGFSPRSYTLCGMPKIKINQQQNHGVYRGVSKQGVRGQPQVSVPAFHSV